MSLDHLIGGLDVPLNLLGVVFELVVRLLVVFLLVLLLQDGLLFQESLLLQLGDLLRHSSELHPQLCDLLLSFKEVLGVKVSVRSNSFVQVLLLLELALSLDILLLEFGDDIVVKLHLLKALVVLGVSLRGLKTVLLLIILKLVNQLLQLLSLSLVPLNLVLELLELVLKGLNGANLVFFFLLCGGNILLRRSLSLVFCSMSFLSCSTYTFFLS